jgi:hypothetical protein
MAAVRLVRRLFGNIDVFDLVFGFGPWLAAYAAFVSWLNLIVRAVRGEDVRQDRRTTYATAAFIGARAIYSATHTRETVGLHNSVVELRQLQREAAKDAEARDRRMRELLQQAAADAEAREKRAADRERNLYKINVAMAVLAGLTLAAAIVTLVVTIVK